MHYYIDGYNLMFRILHERHPFSDQRDIMIQNLNTVVQQLNLDVTLVFDAQYRIGSGSRSHYKHLEILFSPHNQTADDLILDLIAETRKPKQETIITSDKRLAAKIRHLGAKTISVEQFLKYLDTQPYKKPRPQPTSKPIQQQEAPPVALPLSEDFDHYLQIFEEKFRSLTGGDTKKEPIGQSEQDRWLELFEKRMNEENGA